jgi:hypothetical protein
LARKYGGGRGGEGKRVSEISRTKLIFLKDQLDNSVASSYGERGMRSSDTALLRQLFATARNARNASALEGLEATRNFTEDALAGGGIYSPEGFSFHLCNQQKLRMG